MRGGDYLHGDVAAFCWQSCGKSASVTLQINVEGVVSVLERLGQCCSRRAVTKGEPCVRWEVRGAANEAGGGLDRAVDVKVKDAEDLFEPACGGAGGVAWCLRGRCGSQVGGAEDVEIVKSDFV